MIFLVPEFFALELVSYLLALASGPALALYLDVASVSPIFGRRP